MPDMATNERAEEVVDETINAYRVQKLANGQIRIKSGGRVVHGETYYKALQNYAEWEQADLEDSPQHLRKDHWDSIHDGVIPLLSQNSNGVAPEEILDAVTGQPLWSVIDDMAQNMDHDDLCWCYECERGESIESPGVDDA